MLPDVVSGWDKLSPDGKHVIMNFYCGLHFIVGLADAAESVLSNGSLQFVRSEIKEKHQVLNA